MMTLKKNTKGFTLIELMIVVAIIGILAAVAIPGFMRYIKDSKTAEAKENLKSIGDGALSFFQTEHVTDATTGAVITKQFPSANVCVSILGTGCQNGDVPDELPENGIKSVPGDSFAAEPWISLKFSVGKAFYYQYQYAGTGAATGGDSSFASVARARLDTTAEDPDSCFRMVGTKTTSGEGQIGAMVDLSEDPDIATSCVVTST